MVAIGNVIQTFQVMSNELSTSKILLCPNDQSRTFATNFESLANSHISYFANSSLTNRDNPWMVLSGDANLEKAGKLVGSGLFAFETNNPAIWSTSRHPYAGAIVRSDDAVSQASLRENFTRTGLATNRLAIP